MLIRNVETRGVHSTRTGSEQKQAEKSRLTWLVQAALVFFVTSQSVWTYKKEDETWRNLNLLAFMLGYIFFLLAHQVVTGCKRGIFHWKSFIFRTFYV